MAQCKDGRPGVGKLVVDDIFRGDLRRTLSRDLHDLYDFYVDDETRARVGRMGRLRRWFTAGTWIVKSMLLRLSPARRVLLAAALILLLFTTVQIRTEHFRLGGGNATASFFLVLIVLLLELKDKLLAHDELQVGRAVQIALMPTENPRLAGWDIWLLTRPANEVGGDLVDYLWLQPDRRLALVVGDVVGKGLGAALLMAKLQATVRAFTGEVASLAELGARVNRILCRDGIKGRFATLLYLEVASDSGALRLLNAGHPPPILLQDGALSTLRPTALPVGAKADAKFVEQTLDVAPGGLVMLYSDGVTEARNRERDLFGDKRLAELVAGLSGVSAEEAGGRLLAAVDAFAGEAPPSDDLSLVVLRRV